VTRWIVLKPTDSKNSIYRTSVVARLRATFLFLAIVSLGATFFDLWQLTSLESSHTKLVAGAVPTLRQTHELQGQLSVVLGLAARVEEGQSTDQLYALQERLTEKTALIGHVIYSEKWPEQTLQIRTKIASLLEELKRIQASSINQRLEILSIDDRLRQHWDDLRQTRVNFRDIVEPMLVSSTASLEHAQILRGQSNLGLADSTPASISDRAIYQMNLTQIAYRFTALIDMAENWRIDENGPAISDWTKRLQFDFSGVTQTLIRLPAGPERQRLARELNQARDLLFSDAGLVASLGSKIAKSFDTKRSRD